MKTGILFFFLIASTFNVSILYSQDANEDPHLWLEEIEGKSALDWVRQQNARSLKILEGDPRFKELHQDALAILNSKDRLPLGRIRNGSVYNFWQDENHVRGLWRRASVDSYRNGDPQWEVLIDFDQLAKQEDRNWIYGGSTCLAPQYRHCMIELSDGGKDAAYFREFDTETKQFVANGFFLPEAKSWLDWVDRNTLLVATDWGKNSLTSSGYPSELRLWQRNTPLHNAQRVFKVSTDDVWVIPIVEQEKTLAHQFYFRGVSFFEREYTYVSKSGKLIKLPLPLNSDLEGVLDGRAIFSLREDWQYKDIKFQQGTVVAYELQSGSAETVFRAKSNQSVESVGIGKKTIVIQYLEDVSGKAVRLQRNSNGSWDSAAISLPDNGVVSLVSTGGGTEDALFSFESLTTPDSLYYVNQANSVTKISQIPAFFDATDVTVEQRFTKSKDGTRIPYFIMGQTDVLKSGNAPTVQYGYGGFLAAILPVYYSDPARPQHGALAGKLWVKRGGVLVLSNIRGGSEYGPAWHEAGLKQNRQRIYDDFIAIGEHLIETGVTSPKKLGAIGRSNGGLLMGVMLTQRPDLYNALDIGVPLFDMKRYNKLLAGASWMGEYGNPDIPEQWAYLSKYSPYQKLKANQDYPKVFFYTSTKDDRVHPAHARKAAARLQELGYDFLYYENIEGGHGGTANQDQLAYRTALEYMYFMRQLME